MDRSNWGLAIDIIIIVLLVIDITVVLLKP